MFSLSNIGVVTSGTGTSDTVHHIRAFLLWLFVLNVYKFTAKSVARFVRCGNTEGFVHVLMSFRQTSVSELD